MSEHSRLCPACARPLESGAAPSACLRCQNLYHPECWDPLSHCLAFGCASSPRETVIDLDRQPPPRACPACKHENPAAAQLCLACGARLVEVPARSIFTSAAGWQSATPEGLIADLDRHWETAVQHLYHGDLEAWFAECGRNDLAEAARSARKGHAQHSVGLETFLQATRLVKPPLVELIPAELEMEGPGPLISTTLEIRNAGRGYLSGRLQSDAPWLTLDPEDFAGNRTRVTVVADVQGLPDGAASTTLRVETPALCLPVKVQARRIGIAGAMRLYRDHETMKARALCRKLLEARAADADAAILTAACYLDEDNAGAAVQSLRSLSGACQELPSDVVERVFRWLGENDPAASGVDRVQIFEALIPCAEGPLAAELRQTLAQAAMDRARVAAAAFKSGGTSLWQGRTATTEDAIELLQIAAAYDPSFSGEASTLQKQLRTGVSRGRMAVNLGILLILVALVAAGGASWGWTRMQAAQAEKAAMQAFESKDYAKAVVLLRELVDANPGEMKYQSSLALALAQQSREAEAKGEADRSRSLMQQATELSSGKPEVQKAVAGLLVDWADALEQQGQAGEARVHLEQALQMDPSNTRAQGGIARIKSDTDLYWQANQLADGPLGRQPLDNYKELGAVSAQVENLARVGLLPYQSRMMVAFADLTGDGKKDLIVAGTTGTSQKGLAQLGSSPVGEYSVYSLSGSRLERLYTGTVRETPILTSVGSRNLSGTARSDLILDWLSAGSDGLGSTLLVAYKDGRFVQQAAPSKLPIDVGDRNQDGRAEVWVPEIVADSTGAGDRVVLYKPFLWNEPGFEEAKGDFSQYYRDYKENLEQQIQDNPYPAGDPRFEQYRQDRMKGIALADAILGSR